MKVLVSKYEINAIADKWPLFDCPDYVEVACILPPVADLSPEQAARLKAAITKGRSEIKIAELKEAVAKLNNRSEIS